MERFVACTDSQNVHARKGENVWSVIVNNERMEEEDGEGAGPEFTVTMRQAININTPVLDVNGDTFVSGDYQPSETEVTTSVRSSRNVDTDPELNIFSNSHEMLDPDDDAIDTDGDERKSSDKFNIDCLNYELQVGYRILVSLMSAGSRCVNKLFLYPVDDTFPETADYYEKIKNPMWMFKMKEKFENQEYKDLPEFMSDFRLMIENCYRFNGPDNFVSKKAQKLEMMMKQKIALLSRELREKITFSSATNTEDDILTSAGLRRRVRNPNALLDDPSQQLLSQLRRDREMQERVDRRQKVEDRKAMEQARIQELQEWEDKLLGPEVKEQMRTMWELPQIGLFVYLCMESLGLEEEVTQYHIERGLAVPRECSDFKRLMTCLLSTQHQRKNLKNFMPYPVWNDKLTQKLDYFYKVLSDKQGNQAEACFILGLDTRAFKIMGKSNPLLKKQFHQLSYLKRVWILKNFCDYCMETQPYLQKTIDDIEAVRPMDVREVLLGFDGRGNRYINFPMFTGKDIRIYKHPKFPEPSLESLNMNDWSHETEKFSASSSRCSTPVNQKNNRVAETPLSLRTKALLQAVESKESSPMRDTTETADAAKSSAASTPWAKSSPASDCTSGDVKTGKQASSKKRKWSGLVFSKRKRLKTGSKKAAPDDTKNTEKSEESFDNNEENCDNNKATINGTTAQLITGDNSVSCDDHLTTVVNITSPNSSFKASKEDTASSPSSIADDSCNDRSASKTQDRPESNISCVREPNSKHCFDFDHTSSGFSSCNNTLSPEANGVHNGHLEESIFKCDNKHIDKCDIPEGSPSNRESHSTSVLNGHTGKEAESETELLGEKKISGVFPTVKQENLKLGEAAVQSPAEGPINVKEEGYKDLKNDIFDCKTFIKCELRNGVNHGCQGEKNGIKGEKTEVLAVTSAKCEVSKSVTAKELKGRDVTEGSHFSENKLCLNSVKDEEVKEKTLKKEEDIKQNSEKAVKKEEDIEEKAVKKEEDIEENSEKAVKKEEGEPDEDSDEEELPDIGQIELVAESMEEIRQLMNKINNPEPTKKGKRMFPGVMKACEQELVAAVSRFHDELSRYERSLGNARIEMQSKLRKDVESYVEAKVEETKGWDSDHSHASKDSSDDEDSDSKADNEGAKKLKKVKQKPLTPALLSSKLSSAAGEGNEDSSDSFELDISSRGRLRKRRIIPNNTEDTGLKKRKNLPNQDSFFSAATTISAAVTTATSSAAQMTFTTSVAGLGSSTSQMSALTNSAIRAQLAAQTTKSPGQIVRLVAPTGDGMLKTLHVGKPNVILASQNLSNIRFISSTTIANIPRSKVLTASSAQSAHPVIQQLLLNQAASSVNSGLTTAVLTNRNSSGLLGQPLKHLSAAGATMASLVSPGKSPLAITSPASVNPTAQARPTLVMNSTNSAASVAVVVTQMSTTVTQGGKQVLDIGSLSASQLQQLMKNNAIHITTGPRGPTTLLLTSGLQQLNTARPDAASSLISMIKKPQRVAVPQISPSFKTNPLLTLPRQATPQILRPVVPTAQPQTVNCIKVNTLTTPQITISLNQALTAAALQTYTSKSISLVHSTTMLASPTQVITKSLHGSEKSHVASVTMTQKPIPSPRIISSLAPTRSGRVLFGAGSTAADQKSALSSSLGSSANKPWAVASPDCLKPKIITVPLVHLSPSKKYANNVTVKALLENRGTKKSSEEEAEASDQLQSVTSLTTEAPSESDLAGNSRILQGIPSLSVLENGVRDANWGNSQRVGGASISSSVVSADNLQAGCVTGSALMSALATSRRADNEIKQLLPAKLSHSAVTPLTHPISVDTALQSITASQGGTSEIILPTMNIKVPSPNTLPSVQHNKNGTTIVQSTKVPIPMASEAKTGDSLSPSSTIASFSIPQVTALQNVKAASVRAQAHPNSLVIIPGTNASVIPAVRKVESNPQLNDKPSQTVTSLSGLKNITLKLMPQASGSGHVVQGFMTPRGLVIPQAALLQQSHQTSSVMLNSIAYPGAITQLQPNTPVQIQQQQPSMSIDTSKHSQQMQPLHMSSNAIVAAQSSVTPSVLSQGTSPSLKVVLQKAPFIPAITPSSTAATLPDQQASTTTPASELVKQIASNTQLISGSQQKTVVNPKTIRPVIGQQNTVQFLNLVQNSGLQPNSNSTILNSLSNQNAVSVPTTLSTQLTPQILALQQNNQIQRQQNMVLTDKIKQNQGAEVKPSKVALQVGQVGQLISNVGGVTQLQLGGIYQGSQQTQQQLSPRVVQPNQILQLTIGQPSGGQSVLAVPQSPQVVQVSGALSPQSHQRNQGVASIQPQGNIVIQPQALMPQQTIQGVILPQTSLSQPVLGSNIVQPNTVQLHISNLQQPLTKLSQNLAPRTQPSATGKIQLSTGSLAQGQQQQQLLSTAQTSNLISSQLQIPRVSQVSNSVTQTHVHFVVNPASTSLSTLSAPASSVNKMQVDALTGADNISRVIRADSSLAPVNLNSNSTGILGLTPAVSSANQTGQAVIAGSVASTSSLATRSGAQVIITNSRTGHLMLTPVNTQNPQANILNSASFVSAVHTQSSNPEFGQASSPLVVNCPVSTTALVGLPTQIPSRPAVIYAGQPLVVSDKKEGKIAQILLGQHNAVSAQVVSNPTASVSKLQSNVSGVKVSTNSSSDVKMFLYKIGDQYFSSAANIQQIPQAGVLKAPVVASTPPKPDVQFLVPPAFIEASDQLLQQSCSSTPQTNLLQASSLAPNSLGTVASSITSTGNLEFSQSGQKVRSNQVPTIISSIPNTNQSLTAINGVYQGATHLSFSIPSATPVVNGHSAGSVSNADGATVMASEATSSPSIGKSSGSCPVQNYESLFGVQDQPTTNAGISSTGKILQDKVPVRRNTFTNGQHSLGVIKGSTSQRHLSADDSALTLEERDEKEAALNLLTLANQI